MKIRSKDIIGFLLLFQLVFPQGNKNKQIDSLLTSYHKRDLFNGIALVVDNDQIILHKTYGVSDKSKNQAIKLNDRFYIGSLTKQFTAVLILQLQEEGLIDINKPISNYLKEFNKSPWADISVYQMLTHTSGLGSYTSHPDFDRSKPFSDKKMFDFIKQPLLFKPGSEWSYSNSGYFLLGKIAERVTNKSYGILLKEKIFSPLGMKNSAFNTKWLKKNLAKGHWKTPDGILPMPKYSLKTLFSTGGIYSTAEDLFIWNQALYTNKLLTNNSKNILFEPIKNDYACGLFVKKGVDEMGNNFERHFHGGIIQGYHSFVLKRVPQKQLIVLLDNFYNQEIQTIKNRIWSALIEEKIREIKPKLSNILFDACAEKRLVKLIDSISNNLDLFKDKFTFEEFDINSVAYRLMENKRYLEANELFKFNITLYPDSWNVYDSMGELQLKQKNNSEAEKLYKKSLELNPNNDSAKRALNKIQNKK